MLLQQRKVDLGLVAAVGDHAFVGQTQLGSDLPPEGRSRTESIRRKKYEQKGADFITHLVYLSLKSEGIFLAECSFKLCYVVNVGKIDFLTITYDC